MRLRLPSWRHIHRPTGTPQLFPYSETLGEQTCQCGASRICRHNAVGWTFDPWVKEPRPVSTR